MDIEFEKIIAFVKDSATYCKKKLREVLSNIFNSYHVLCLTHILNLVGEVFSHWPAFDNVTQFTTFIKSAFLEKKKKKKWNGLKIIYLKNKWNYLLYQWQPDGIPGLMQPDITHPLYNFMKDSVRVMTL